MAIYFLTCFLSMGIAWMGLHDKSIRLKPKRNIRLTAFFSSLPLFILSALRYGIGTDYKNYALIYNLYIPNGVRRRIEPLFYILNRIVYRIAGNQYQWLFVALSAVYILFIFWAIFKLSPNPPLSIYFLVTMTFYMSSFNTTRENIGCAILLLSVYYIQEKNFLKFLICVLIASGFHYVCILFLIAYVFAYYKITFKRALAWSILFFASSSIIERVAIQIIYLFPKYTNYITENREVSINAYLGLMIQIAILLFATYVGKKYDVKDKVYNIYFGIETLALWVSSMGSFITIVNRVKWIFSITGIIFVPIILGKIENRRERLLFFLIACISFGIYSIIVVGLLHSYSVVPYRSIFSK